MKICAMCGRKVVVDKYFNRQSTCPGCGEGLHICMNCRHYTESSRHWCLNDRAELPRTRDKANFCDYFRYREGGTGKGAAGDERADVKRRFDDLFK